MISEPKDRALHLFIDVEDRVRQWQDRDRQRSHVQIGTADFMVDQSTSNNVMCSQSSKVSEVQGGAGGRDLLLLLQNFSGLWKVDNLRTMNGCYCFG